MKNQIVKAQIRAWLLQRTATPVPLPEPKQIRDAVGWSTLEEAQDKRPEQYNAKRS